MGTWTRAYQMIPDHGNPQKRRAMFDNYLLKYIWLRCIQKFLPSIWLINKVAPKSCLKSFTDASAYLTNIFHVEWKQCPIKVLLYPAHSPFFKLFSFQEKNVQSELPWAYKKEFRPSSKLRRGRWLGSSCWSSLINYYPHGHETSWF